MPRAFLDGLGVGLALNEAHTGRFLFANREGCRLLGYSEQELVAGKITFRDITHPEDRERNEAEHRRLLAGDIRSYNIEKRYVLADGGIMWANVIVRAIEDSKGELRWCSAAILDITAAKLTERQLVAAQSVAGLATWNFEVKTNSNKTSRGYAALLGIPSASAAPSLDEMLSRVHPDDHERVNSTIRNALASGTGYMQEYRVVDEHGQIRWLRGFATCLYDAAGTVTNLVGATVDITSSKAGHHGDMPRPMREILKYIDENWNKRLNAEEVAFRHGVSSRSLYRFFETRGGTFTGHIKRLRLQHARRMLIEARPGATVTAIALACGFSNHGHFARDYHDEFGELPSDTLRR